MKKNSVNPKHEREVWEMWCRLTKWEDIPSTLQEAENRLLQEAMAFARNNRSMVCRILGLTQPRLVRCLKSLGLLLLLVVGSAAQDTLIADSTSKIPVLVPGEGVTEAIGRWLYLRDNCADTGYVYLTLNVAQNAWIDSVAALHTLRGRYSDCIDTLGRYRGLADLFEQTATVEERTIDTLRTNVEFWKRECEALIPVVEAQGAVIDSLRTENNGKIEEIVSCRYYRTKTELLLDTLRTQNSLLGGQVLAFQLLADSLNWSLKSCNFAHQLLADSLVWYQKERARMQRMINSQALMIGPLMSAKVVLESKLAKCLGAK